MIKEVFKYNVGCIRLTSLTVESNFTADNFIIMYIYIIPTRIYINFKAAYHNHTVYMLLRII